MPKLGKSWTNQGELATLLDGSPKLFSFPSQVGQDPRWGNDSKHKFTPHSSTTAGSPEQSVSRHELRATRKPCDVKLCLPRDWRNSWTLEPRHLGKLVRWSQFQEVNLWSGLFTSPRQGHCVSHSMWPRAFREGCCSLSLLPVVAKGSTQAGRRVSRMPRANRFLFQKLCHPEVLTPAIGRHYWLTLGFFYLNVKHLPNL